MKKGLLFLIFGLLLAVSLKGQTYTHGDITVTLQTSAIHDSNICLSIGQISYVITIQNSFVGDTVKVFSQQAGLLSFESINTTGQSPWVDTVLIYGGLPGPDYMVSGGLVSFNYILSKVISGPDTIYNIQNSFTFPVSNPCLYDTVSGRVYLDYNNNCLFDSSSDGLINGIRVEFQSVVNPPNGSYIQPGGVGTHSQGAYSNPLMQKTWLTSYNVELAPNFNFLFPSTGCAPVVYNFTTLPQHNIDFVLQCSANIDVQCFAGSPMRVRPLVPFFLRPTVSNIGCDTMSGVLSLVLDSRVAYNAAQSINPASIISGDTLKWNYSNLNILSNGAYWNSFFSGVHLTPNGTVNIGDTLCFTLFTPAPSGDIDSTNNVSTFCIPVENSFDPNLKEVIPQGEGVQGFIPASTSELTYTIHFQNTGNAQAFNVSVIDTLDNNIQPLSLQILGADHTMNATWLNDNTVKFIFNGINLPDSASNEAESHGMLKFKVKSNSALPPGTQIKNQAAIYFDNNPAIFTNTTINTIAIPNSISQFAIQNPQFNLSPNPATTQLNIQVDEALLGAQLNIYNVTGAVVQTAQLQTQQSALNIQQLPSGVYIAEVTPKSAQGHFNTVQRVKWVKM